MTEKPEIAEDAPRCLITGDLLTAVNNSRAHIIPSALGGRLKPLDVLSKRANSELGDTVDQLLIDALFPIMTQLDGSRDRGRNQPIDVEDADGRRYRIEFGKAIQLAVPEYRETEEPDRTVISVQARTMKEMRTLLGRVRSKVPGFNIEEAMKHAQVVRSWPTGGGRLRSKLEIGPRRTFPALFVAASVFSVSKGLPAHPGLRNYVRTFDVNELAQPPDTFNFYSARPWATAPGEVTHKVVLVADPERGRSLVFFELFNLLEIAVTLPFAGRRVRVETYGVDVLTGAEVPVTVDVNAILTRSWEASHDLDPTLWKIIEDRLGRIVGIAQRRGTDDLIRQELEEVEARLKGDGPLSARSLLRALEVPTEYLEIELQRPGMTPERGREMAEGYAAMLGSTAALLPPDQREGLDAALDALIRRIARAAGLEG